MRKKSAKTFAALVALMTVPALMTGCLVEGPAVVPSPSALATATLTLSPPPTAAPPTAEPTSAPTPAAAATPDAAQKALLVQIRAEAEKGKTINCEYPLKSNMTAIEDDWGAPDFSEYVADAKGEYALYETRDTAFGFNKGAQVFEVRSFDERLGQLRLSAVKNEYGAPPHEATTPTDRIIGYYAGAEYRLLLVFPKPTPEDPDPLLDHYSVFYPAGTVNMMADDPGREW